MCNYGQFVLEFDAHRRFGYLCLEFVFPITINREGFFLSLGNRDGSPNQELGPFIPSPFQIGPN